MSFSDDEEQNSELYTDGSDNQRSAAISYKAPGLAVLEKDNQSLTEENNKLHDEIKYYKSLEEKNKYEISLLKSTSKKKEERIKELREELSSIRNEKNELIKHVEKLEYEFQMLIVDKTRYNRSIDSKKVESLTQELRILSTLGKQSKNDQTSKSSNSAIKLKSTLASFNKLSVWKIDEVLNKRETGKAIMSEHFYARKNPYKMKLSLVNYGTTLQIRLLICSGINDADLRWPFRADVTIQIVNPSNKYSCKRVTEHREIDRPQQDSFTSSSPFVFSYAELFDAGLLESECFIIEFGADIK